MGDDDRVFGRVDRPDRDLGGVVDLPLSPRATRGGGGLIALRQSFEKRLTKVRHGRPMKNIECESA
jgi:hypothetical protein